MFQVCLNNIGTFVPLFFTCIATTKELHDSFCTMVYFHLLNALANFIFKNLSRNQNVCWGKIKMRFLTPPMTKPWFCEPKQTILGRGGIGQVVKWSAYLPATPTIVVQIPLTPTVFSIKFMFEKTENKQKEAGVSPFFKNIVWVLAFPWSTFPTFVFHQFNHPFCAIVINVMRSECFRKMFSCAFSSSILEWIISRALTVFHTYNVYSKNFYSKTREFIINNLLLLFP